MGASHRVELEGAVEARHFPLGRGAPRPRTRRSTSASRSRRRACAAPSTTGWRRGSIRTERAASRASSRAPALDAGEAERGQVHGLSLGERRRLDARRDGGRSVGAFRGALREPPTARRGLGVVQLAGRRPRSSRRRSPAETRRSPRTASTWCSARSRTWSTANAFRLEVHLLGVTKNRRR